MQKIQFLLFIFLISNFCFGQKEYTNWYAFYNADSTKIGYKDAEGNVKIQPKFETFITPDVFDNVIAVVELTPENRWKTYYLNKNGKIFGKDDVYMAGTSDFAEDPVEYNGIIKFRNSKSGLVGFFDYNGKIIIQDKYNDLTNFHNGIARGLRGAVWSKCNYKKEDCEHKWWQGGNVFAINTKGDELFELPHIYSSEIDYEHVKINENVDKDVYVSYKGIDGNTYSFLNPEKDFTKWFNTIFLSDFKKYGKVLPKYYYDLIYVGDVSENLAKEKFLSKYEEKMNFNFNKVLFGEFQFNPSWEKDSNRLYYDEINFPKQNLKDHIVIEILPRAKDDFSGKNAFQFTKIGDSYYITSAP